jgi:hypothetical protein
LSSVPLSNHSSLTQVVSNVLSTWSCPCDLPSVHHNHHHNIIILFTSHKPRGAKPQSLDLRDPRKYIPKTLVDSRHHSLHSQTTSCSISLTRGTRLSCKPQNAATFSICFHLCQPIIVLTSTSKKREQQIQTYTLLHNLHILKTHPDPPRPSQMPPRLPG